MDVVLDVVPFLTPGKWGDQLARGKCGRATFFAFRATCRDVKRETEKVHASFYRAFSSAYADHLVNEVFKWVDTTSSATNRVRWLGKLDRLCEVASLTMAPTQVFQVHSRARGVALYRMLLARRHCQGDTPWLMFSDSHVLHDFSRVAAKDLSVLPAKLSIAMWWTTYLAQFLAAAQFLDGSSLKALAVYQDRAGFGTTSRSYDQQWRPPAPAPTGRRQFRRKACLSSRWCDTLETLVLSRTYITSAAATLLHLGKKPHLTSIHLDASRFGPGALRSLQLHTCANLTDLCITGTDIGNEEVEMLQLFRLPRLEKLSLADDSITDLACVPTHRMPRLLSLDLQKNRRIRYFSLAPNSSLVHLNLNEVFGYYGHRNDGVHIAFDSFAGWFNANESLEELHLEWCAIDDFRLNRLRLDAHPSLKTLLLGQNRFGQAGVQGSGMLHSNTLAFVSWEGNPFISAELEEELLSRFPGGRGEEGVFGTKWNERAADY